MPPANFSLRQPFLPLSCLCITLLLALLMNPGPAAAAEKAELVILNWSEYVLPEMITAFEAQHNVKVKQIYFESDDARDQILLQTKGKGFDLILVNAAVIGTYRKRGWLQPVPLNTLKNLKHIDTKWLNASESAKGYGIPYFWGTLGIAYRKDLLSEPLTSWKQFFNPSKELQGKILLVKSSRDIIGMALKSLGYSANSENTAELQQVEKLLITQKPHIARYGYITMEKDSSLVTGEIVAATVYGGDALNVAEHNENIVYVLPEEGGNIWIDYFTLSASAKEPALATAFIDFINQPDWAAKNAENMYLATPNTAATRYLSKAFLHDPVIYPNEAALSRSEFYKDLSPRAVRTRAEIFSRIIN